jgi:hypothetical protein
MKNKYPIYIISKGRADSRFTARSLDELKVPYSIVIEESEYSDYAAVIDPSKILVLPKDFREDPKYAIKCEVTGHLGGSIPARNFVLEHSKSLGFDRHWIMDDNIRYFYRFNQRRRRRMYSGSFIRIAEDFVDRYTNVKIAGLNYMCFVIPSADTVAPPYSLNSRIYSCILLSNDLDIRWRGIYNEDTDISLRILKAGYCSILFNSFCVDKGTTLKMGGGNTEEVYSLNNEYDNRYSFTKSLKDQHPDVTTITQKYGRYHHHVDYSRFVTKLKYRDDIIQKTGINEYDRVYRPLTKKELISSQIHWK